jgi:RNA recognition motif-containing protein
MPPKREGSSSGIAFVEFKTHTGAQKAIDTDGAIILGRKMQISWAKDRAEATANANTFSVFVKNVSFETSSDTLRSIFEDCGDIVSIRYAAPLLQGKTVPHQLHFRMPTFPDTGKPRGYAFVDFKEQSSVKNALKLNRVEVDRRQLLVEAAGSANGSPSN